MPQPPARQRPHYILVRSDSLLAQAQQSSKSVVRKTALALAIPAIGAIGALSAAYVERPPPSPPNCIARDTQIAGLVRKYPDLAPVLERQPDPTDKACGSTGAVLHAILKDTRKHQ